MTERLVSLLHILSLTYLKLHSAFKDTMRVARDDIALIHIALATLSSIVGVVMIREAKERKGVRHTLGIVDGQ